MCSSVLYNLYDVVGRGNFVILDTETTGLHQEGQICQIAIVNSTGDILLDTLIRPSQPIPESAIKIHGISNEQVANAPTWRDITPKIRELLSGRDVLCYNAVFDRRMMHQSAEANGMEKTDWKTLSTWTCAMEAFAEFFGDWNDYHQSFRWQPLSRAAEFCGVEANHAHSALGDCLTTLGVVMYMFNHPEEALNGIE